MLASKNDELRVAALVQAATGAHTAAGSIWYAVALEDMFGTCGLRDWDDMRLVLQMTPVAVPEPGTMGVMMGFLAGGAWLMRRRRQDLA